MAISTSASRNNLAAGIRKVAHVVEAIDALHDAIAFGA